MKVKSITNTSKKDVAVMCGDGHEVVLKPGKSAFNIDVVELNEVKDSTKVIHDLSEVR